MDSAALRHESPQDGSPLPRVYLILGVAGLLPFLAGPVLAATGHLPFAVLGFTSYSLAIACFLAGSWWGLAVARGTVAPAQALASNAAVVLAVAAVVLTDPAVSLPILAAVHATLAAGDLSAPALAVPFRGYRTLRAVLTVVAVGCHVALVPMLPG